MTVRIGARASALGAASVDRSPASSLAIAAALHLVLIAGCATASAQQRATRAFDGAWRFHLGDVAGAQETTFADAGWRTLDVPHAWSSEGEVSEQNRAGTEVGALP